MAESRTGSAKETEPLSSVVDHLLEECRMVLPGLQALFGFQLIAVFNQTFWDRLTHTQQIIHFVALGVVAVAIALVMTPAAYHRQAERETVSHGFVRLASRLLLWSMFPLLTGICLDFYLISLLIFKNTEVSLALAAVLSLTFFVLWFVLPRTTTLQDYLRR
jgi:hypothetical protein